MLEISKTHNITNIKCIGLNQHSIDSVVSSMLMQKNIQMKLAILCFPQSFELLWLISSKIKTKKIIYTYIIWSIVTILCRVVSFWYTPAIHFGRLGVIWIFLFLVSCWCFLLARQTHTSPHLFFLRLLTYSSGRSTTICSSRNLN